MTTTNKPRLLMVSNLFSAATPGWGVCRELKQRFEAEGHEVLITSTQTSKIFRLLDMTLTPILKHKQFDLAMVDVFSGAAFIWAEFACFALRLVGKPYILTLRGGYLPRHAKRQPKRIIRLLKSAVSVTTPSRFLYEQMHPFFDDYILLPNNIDISRYRYRHRANPTPKLIWLRAFHHTYNPALAPRFMSLLVKDFPGINLVMTGPDKGDGSLQNVKELIKELGLESHIELRDRVDKEDVPNRLNEGDIFINTTNVDNTPVSVMEAMACGLCVVTTNVGGIPYLVNEGEDAITVDPDDPELMADAIRRILKDNKLAGKLSATARRNMEQYDTVIIIPKWLEIFKRAVGEPS
ncbi:glycosyltransferase family 4 protein [Calditrichota bacterium]